jgi:hypothetical protein
MTVYTILKEYTWLVNTIHHAGIRTPGQESCDFEASIINSDSAPLLLGQSALSRLGKIQIDYQNSTLTIIR